MIRSSSAVRTLLALAILAAAALPLAAQKSTLSSGPGRAPGGFAGRGSPGGFIGGRTGPMGPVVTPRSPASSGTFGSPTSMRAIPSAPTLSPAFPSAGRGVPVGSPLASAGGRSGKGVIVLPGSGTLSPGFPVRGREPAPVRLGGGPSGALPAGKASLPPGRTSLSGGKTAFVAGAGGGKRFLPVGTLPRNRFDDGRRTILRGRTVVLFDPFFFGSPFFFSNGAFFGSSFFVTDPFFFRDRFVFGDPFFFRHRFPFGRPFFFGPPAFSLFLGWPGFWTQGWWGSDLDYTTGYRQGFDQGYASGNEAGYTSGTAAVSGGYAYDQGLYEGPTAGYGSEGFPASARFAEGRRRMAEGSYGRALAAFDAYLREFPADGRGDLARGVALVALRRYGEAAQAFRRGVDDYGPGASVSFDMPALFGSRTSFRATQGALEDYVRTHADDVSGRFDLGVLYLFSGERDAAQSLLGGLGDDPYASRLLGL